MRLIRNLYFFLLLGLVACSRNENIEIELSGESWVVDGTLVTEGGHGVSDERIQLLRVEMRGGEPAGHFFAAIKTNSEGRFYFETPIDGVYTLVVGGGVVCAPPVELGEMKSGRKSVKIVVKPEGCAIIL